jgi:hypothetical protein
MLRPPGSEAPAASVASAMPRKKCLEFKFMEFPAIKTVRNFDIYHRLGRKILVTVTIRLRRALAISVKIVSGPAKTIQASTNNDSVITQSASLDRSSAAAKIREKPAMSWKPRPAQEFVVSWTGHREFLVAF